MDIDIVVFTKGVIPIKTVLRCDRDTLSKDISGKTYIITGANSGVGLETTRQLISQGGHVVMACRRVGAAQEVAQGFEGLNGSYDIIQMDLASLQFAREFLSKYSQLTH